MKRSLLLRIVKVDVLVASGGRGGIGVLCKRGDCEKCMWTCCDCGCHQYD